MELSTSIYLLRFNLNKYKFVKSLSSMDTNSVPWLNFTTSTFSVRENQSAPSAALHVTSYEVIYAVTRVTINVILILMIFFNLLSK